jgi:hypothetical protein
VPADGGTLKKRGKSMKEVTVFVTGVEPMADMAMDLLRAEGIPARKSVYYRELSNYPLDGLGKVEVTVPETAAQQALDILSARFSGIEGEAETDDDDESGDDPENGEKDSHDLWGKTLQAKQWRLTTHSFHPETFPSRMRSFSYGNTYFPQWTILKDDAGL